MDAKNRERIVQELLCQGHPIAPDVLAIAEGWRRMQSAMRRHLDPGEPLTEADALNEIYGVLDDEYLNLTVAALEH